MWTPSLPVYTVPKGKGARRKDDHFTVPVVQSISDLLEPALEGPPSPERLRQLNQQMKRSSFREKHFSQQTTSSGSSSLISSTSWEHSLENLTLSRKSSQRSTTSNTMPSRDHRPESVQIFGKTLFNRKGKLRRESADHGSSTNSLLYSPEFPDSAPVAPRDPHFFNAMLTKRKTSKGENDKKLQISGPYNFQHVTHTNKASVPDLHERLRSGSIASIQADGLHFPNFSSDALPVVHQDPSAGLYTENNFEPHTRISLSRPHIKKRSSPPRLVPRTRSQEQVRSVPPPRPPRSPIDHDFNSYMPPPPPRMSSRTSTAWYEGSDTERPASSTGFRQSRPYALSPTEVPEPPATSTGVSFSPDQERAVDSHRFSNAITTPDDAAWPLSSNVMTPLPDVPEEEEHHGPTHQSRASLASNNSSLRGSVSVPLLRRMSQSQSQSHAHTHKRPPSNASETLGRFDLFAAQRALRTPEDDESVRGDIVTDSWEDDIDYCYEHAAEADCDFAWERPSVDLTREDDQDTVGYESAGNLLPAVHFDIPDLSPVSHISNSTPIEALTPTIMSGPVTSNFSLPRRESAVFIQRHNRTASQASSFKESQGFTISPSLLIPNDFHQQMLLEQREREELRDQEDDSAFSPHGSYFGPLATASQARSSASTTDSAISDNSSRHKSATSTSTAFTRWTSSSNNSWKAHADDDEHSAEKLETDAVSPLPEIKEARAKREFSHEKHVRAQSHTNLLSMQTGAGSILCNDMQDVKESFKTRRRAKTTSRSNMAPSFNLFPNTDNTVGSRI